MERINYLEWRNRTSNEVPTTHRLGNDLLLIEDYKIIEDYTEPFKSDITTVIIYEEGSADIRINMQEYHVTAPAMVVMLSDQTFQYLSKDNRPKVKAFVFSNKLLEGLFNDSHTHATLYRVVFNNPVLQLDNDSKYMLATFYNVLHGLIKAPTGENRLEAAKHLILALFYGYMSNNQIKERSKDENRNRATDLSDKFLELLRANYKTNRDIGFYADKMYVTPKYLSRCVKEVTGRTAGDWIDNHVITESKALLASTRLTIQQISDRMGFLSTALFGKFFKRVEGITPSAYRKSRRN